MTDRGDEFGFFQDMEFHVNIDIRVDISISIRPMITKVGWQVDLQDMTQKSLIKNVLVTPLRQDHVTN